MSLTFRRHLVQWFQFLGVFVHLSSSARGCCTCGRPTCDWMIWDACDLYDADDRTPDWAECKKCADKPDSLTSSLPSRHVSDPNWMVRP